MSSDNRRDRDRREEKKTVPIRCLTMAEQVARGFDEGRRVEEPARDDAQEDRP